MCLYEGGGNDKAAALHEERSAESPTRFWPYEARVGEEEASTDEEDDRGERFQPAIRVIVGLPGGAEGQKYRIPLS